MGNPYLNTRAEANISLPLMWSNMLQTLGYGNKLLHSKDDQLLMDVDLLMVLRLSPMK